VKYKRWLSQQIETALQDRRAVILVGPRQSGKTTLARDLARTLVTRKIDYRTLDDVTLLEAARSDPHAFA